MENEHFSQYGTQSTRESKADSAWSDFQRDLDRLGRQLAELQQHTAALGTHLVSSLEGHFEDVRIRADRFRQERELELEQLRETATREAESTFNDVRQRSSEAARQMWERSEPLRQGAKDVGEGLARAWVELRASLGKAAGRLHSETPTNGPARATIDERQERS